MTTQKFTSMPQFSVTGDIHFGPYPTDVAALKTKINGEDYYYIPQDYIQKGITSGGYYNNPRTYFSPQFLSSDFQQELKDKGTYVDIGSVENPNGGTYGDYLGAVGRSTKGYFVPATSTVTKALDNWQTAPLGPNGESGIVGVGNSPDGLAYMRTNTNGNDLSYTLPSGQSAVWNKPKQTTFQKFISDLGPLPAIATAIFAPEFLPLVSGAQTAIQGGDIEDILKSAGTSYALGQIGQQAGILGDQAAAATQYGTDLGSAQTAMLAAQEAGMGSAADMAGNVLAKGATSAASSALTGGKTDPLAALISMGASTAAPMLTNEIEGFSDLPIRAQNAINAVVASEMAGKDPTNAVISEALRAGKDAYNNESKALAAGWDSYDQLKDAASLGIGTKDAYLSYQQGAPADDGTTAGIQDIINQTQTGAKDDGTTAGIQEVINQIPPSTPAPEPEPQQPTPAAPPATETTPSEQLPLDVNAGSLGANSDMPPTEDAGGSLGNESDLPPVTEEEPQCAPGYHWDGSMCVSDEDVTDTSTSCPEGYIFDLNTHSCVPVGTTETGTTQSGPASTGTTKPGTTTPGKTPSSTTPTGTQVTQTTGTTPATSGATTSQTAANSNNLLALLSLLGGHQQATPTPLADIKYYYDFGDELLNPGQKDDKAQKGQFEFFDGGEIDEISVDDLIGLLKGD